MQLIEPTRISAQLLDYAPPDGVTFNEFRLQTLRVAPRCTRPHGECERTALVGCEPTADGGRRLRALCTVLGARGRRSERPDRCRRRPGHSALLRSTIFGVACRGGASARVPACVGSMRNCRQPAATFLHAAVRCQGDLVIGGAERVHVPRGSVFLVPAGVPLPIANESAAAAGACLARASIGLYPSSAVLWHCKCWRVCRRSSAAAQTPIACPFRLSPSLVQPCAAFGGAASSADPALDAVVSITTSETRAVDPIARAPI